MRVWETPGLREIRMNAEIGAHPPERETTDPTAAENPERKRELPLVVAGGAVNEAKRVEPPDDDPVA